MLQIFLSKLGLTKNEQDIYLFLLGHGAAIASIISKRLKIKRVTVYASLESLSKKSLILSDIKNNITYFSAITADKIVNLCAEKVAVSLQLKAEAEAVLQDLKAIEFKRVVPILEVEGKVKYYQGLAAVKNLIEETLEEPSSEQLCFGLNTYHLEHLADEWKKYTKKRVSIAMKVKSIQPDIPAAKEYARRDQKELRTTHLVPHKKFPAHCELNIIGDMIAIFTTHGDEPTGMKIYNKDMAEIIRSLFQLAWEQAQKYHQE